MSLANASSKRHLGDIVQKRRRSDAKEVSDQDTAFNPSTVIDHDSSYASSSAEQSVIIEEKTSRAKLGGFGALGDKIRSLSSGQRKSQSTEVNASLPKINRSKSSLVDDIKKNSRSSRLFDALGFKSRIDLTETVTSVGLETEIETPSAEAAQLPSTPLPRLSVTGLSNRFNRSSSYFSLDPASPAHSTAEGASSPGDFNLRSFRNVRDQSSSSYSIAPMLKPSPISPPLISSASQYAALSPSESNAESFISVEDDPSHFPPTISPQNVSPARVNSNADQSPSGSRPNSPRMDAARIQGGSISAGRFRKSANASHHNLEELSKGTSTPTEGFQRLTRPDSPFMNMTASPSETLAALEAEVAKGRRKSLMMLNQGEASPQSTSLTKDVNGTSLPRKGNGDGSSPYQEVSLYQPNEANSRDQSIAPPRLPWLRDEAESARRRGPSSFSFSQVNTSRGDLMSPLANVSLKGDMRIILPRAVDGSAISTVDLKGTTFPDDKRNFVSPSPRQDDPLSAVDGHAARQGNQRWSLFNGATLNNFGGNHRRGDSMPFESTFSRLTNGHRRATSIVNDSATVKQIKVDELLSFHEQQAPRLAAAQSQNEIPQLQGARIAWPSPPCIKLEYFSHLSALHQHSLYEQHCKAADHALAEYLRLMQGAVPLEAMTQPGPLFNTSSSLQSRQSLTREKGRRLSESSAFNHNRSRSISVPGPHGSSNNHNFRRSLTPSKTKPEVPVPPLPSESMLEKMEERIQNSRNSTITSSPLL